MNIYVRRNVNGKVDLVSANPYEDENGAADEVLPDDHPDVAAFLNPVATLEQVKTILKASIDAAAELERQQYITPGSGQAMTYMQKADEAARYLAASEPAATDYPLLLAEVGITAPTIGEVATIVNVAYAQWQQIGAAIESARLGTKAAIDAANTLEEAQAAADAVVWPTNG